MQEVSCLAERWQELGTSLGINKPDLETIRFDSPVDCLTKTLTLWLRQSYEVWAITEPHLVAGRPVEVINKSIMKQLVHECWASLAIAPYRYFLYTDKEVWEANLEEVGGGSGRPWRGKQPCSCWDYSSTSSWLVICLLLLTLNYSWCVVSKNTSNCSEFFSSWQIWAWWLLAQCAWER